MGVLKTWLAMLAHLDIITPLSDIMTLTWIEGRQERRHRRFRDVPFSFFTARTSPSEAFPWQMCTIVN